MGVLREIGRTLAGALAIVWQAVRLLLAHWPVLVVVLLLGAAARELALWGSFELSKVSPVAATITVALAPLASVIALIVALRVLMPSLGSVAGDEARMPLPRQLVVVGSALVPFLAVYAAQGYLRKDSRRFVNEVTVDEFNSTDFFAGETMDERTWAGASWVVTVAIIVIALVLRWGLDRWGLAQRHWGFGFLAGWLEALWLLTIAKAFSSEWGRVWEWILDRRGVHWLVEGYETVVRVLGPVGAAVDGVVGWLLGIAGRLDTLVVVPLAWLTVGAIVYGRELGKPAAAPDLGDVRERVVGSIEDERVRRRLERLRRRAELARQRAEAVRARTSIVPAWLREWLAQPVTSVTGRFSSLGKGLLTLVRAGLIPMVTLCLVLLAGRRVGSLVADLARAVIGPLDPAWGVAISPMIDVVLMASNTLIMVVLIAAAVDRFLARPAQEIRAESELSDAAADGTAPA